MAMSIERRQKIATEKRQLILQSALLLFNEKGYQDTTISDIATKAGISKGLIYKYFSSKKELLLSFGDIIRECETLVKKQKSSTESLRLFAKRVLMDYKVTGYRAPIRILVMCYIDGDLEENEMLDGFSFKDYGRTFFGHIIKKGQENGEFRSGNPEDMGDIFWHTIIGYTVHMMHSPQKKVSSSDIESIIGILYK